MKKISTLTCLLVYTLVSCDNSSEKSISGQFSFEYLKKGEGIPAKDGEYILLNFTGIDSNDSVWFDRKVNDDPFVLKKDSAKWIAGEDWIYEIFFDLVPGDSISLTVEPARFVKEALPFSPSEKIKNLYNLTLFAGVYQVMNYEEYLTFMTVTLEEIKKLESEKRIKRLEEEKNAISTLIKENNWVSDSTKEGLHIVILKKGEGVNASPGQKLTVNYTASILNGPVVDTSIEEEAKRNSVFNPNRKYGAYQFVLNQSSVIQGWHDGFKYLNKGCKAILLVPADLAYGEMGNPSGIPPFATLKFEVEVLNIE